MNGRSNLFLKTAVLGSIVGLIAASSAQADGTEELGPTAVGPGSGVVVAGTGAEVQPATINLAVPGSLVNQALLYWTGEGYLTGDDTIDVDNGGGPVAITGELIGGPTHFYSEAGFGAVHVSTYRADVTNMISVGANTLTISGMDFGFGNNGAGLLVVYDDGTVADIDLRDGQDLAYAFFAPPLDGTVPQTFDYAASASDRTATLDMFFSSVAVDRPNVVRIAVQGGDVIELVDELASVDGLHWDTLTVVIDIPAGSSALTVQAFSEDATGSGGQPASFNWLGAALSVEMPEPPAPCRVTGGGSDCADFFFVENECSMARGRAKKHREQFNSYTFGGQCGAPGSLFGEWTHANHDGPSGKWTFHAGTHSAPANTYLKVVECLDDPACHPAAANGPNKQIVCEGVGSFRNGTPPMGAVAGLHAVRIRIVDAGEPGKSGKQVAPGHCPPDGFEGVEADCGCPDYYHFTIHETADSGSPVIYDVRGYITHGNLQMHASLD